MANFNFNNVRVWIIEEQHGMLRSSHRGKGGCVFLWEHWEGQRQYWMVTSWEDGAAGPETQQFSKFPTAQVVYARLAGEFV